MLAWGATTELDVRHLTLRQWRCLKQVGLRGYLPDGLLDPAFRVRSPLRNSGAGELTITSGMRLREFSRLLDIEVGPPRRDASPAELMLQAICRQSIRTRPAVLGQALSQVAELPRWWSNVPVGGRGYQVVMTPSAPPGEVIATVSVRVLGPQHRSSQWMGQRSHGEDPEVRRGRPSRP
ncbi:hypothetical protein [Streptomyces sp. 2314.4]|uniref:hypothetical protein n=1 Tax=Streptomyces sp. 2314.4 TaxID=1881025 RepID=UPI0015A19293|nr:hypothetical protein [Streptomyces sp. 2314.4]